MVGTIAEGMILNTGEKKRLCPGLEIKHYNGESIILTDN